MDNTSQRETLIELRHIHKIYYLGGEEVRANDDISLKIDRGEFVAIVGKSGSGKSTLMNIIGALDVPTDGEYLLGGEDVGIMDDKQLARIRNKMIGFIFQQYNRKRKFVLRVPVTPEERALIQQKMAQLGTKNFSAYARKMLIDGYIVHIDTGPVRAQTAELQKIGVNINQIARRINSTGTVYAQDLEDIKGALTQIWQLQRSILSSQR